MPREGASAEEIGQTLAALLEWLVKAAADYRNDRLTGDTLATVQELAPMLDKVSVALA